MTDDSMESDAPKPLPAAYYNTARPATVTAAAVIIVVQSLLGMLLALSLLSVLARVPDGTDGLVLARVLAGSVFAAGIINGVAIVSVILRQGAARWVILVVGGAIVVIDLVTGNPTYGDALWAIAMVLLFVPASTRWFRSRPPAVVAPAG